MGKKIGIHVMMVRAFVGLSFVIIGSGIRHTRTDVCGQAAPGATQNSDQTCKCPSDYALDGDDAACGDGTQNTFRAADVAGKSCECLPLQVCKKVSALPASQFNLNTYISARWYVQQQMPSEYQPVEANNCVAAFYKKKSWNFYGWTVDVQNQAEWNNGTKRGGNLCAYQPQSSKPSELAVAPCFLPTFAAGPYWVLAYDEAEGYALVSGGQPNVRTTRGCTTGTGTNDSGLWIFTRQNVPEDETLVDRVVQMAAEKGFDIRVLNPIRQTGCRYVPSR